MTIPAREIHKQKPQIRIESRFGDLTIAYSPLTELAA
jgi:hypothetical protein